VFSPLEKVQIRTNEKLCLVAMPLKEWKREFSLLTGTIRRRAARVSSVSMERDITRASRERRRAR
jgi:hypothetical protein